ncbi:FAD dependent oxidoreductase [Lentinula aciculospora]|uniref:FAD dependent oxidoreductase n=1 Tax=Lentinula aciculospora TaxID=153920 RepID=A0A9W9DDY2_9AGAR|nr:FAD dependent oxidoreductase [Lentinula aciculospora]
MLWPLFFLLVPQISVGNPVVNFQEDLLFQPLASLPAANATESFWIDTPGANVLANEGSQGPLTEDADICIIGSGMTGISAAYHLAQAVETINLKESHLQVKVVVLEAREFCSGATGRNGGHLTPYSFFNYREYEGKYGSIEALKSLQLENRTAMAMVSVIEKYTLNDIVDLVAGGHVSLISSEKEYMQLRAEYLAAHRAGLNVGEVEWLKKEDVEVMYGASYPAVKFPAFNFWPLKFVTQLYLLANSSSPQFSLTLHTHTPVTSVAPLESSRIWSVNTARGSVKCSQVLHATNGYASHLLPQFSGKNGIIPTRGQIVAVRADAAVSESWKASWGGLDHYWFPRPMNGSDSGLEVEKEQHVDHPLVLLGGGRHIGGPAFEQFETDDSVVNTALGEELRGFLPETFPSMFKKGQTPEMEWTGIMGYTTMSDPFVGPVVEDMKAEAETGLYAGQYISAGYSGHGMPRAFSCAEAVADMIIAAIQDKPWSPLQWLPERYLTTNRSQKKN